MTAWDKQSTEDDGTDNVTWIWKKWNSSIMIKLDIKLQGKESKNSWDISCKLKLKLDATENSNSREN
jgi:hypothetical protein